MMAHVSRHIIARWRDNRENRTWPAARCTANTASITIERSALVFTSMAILTRLC